MSSSNSTVSAAPSPIINCPATQSAADQVVLPARAGYISSYPGSTISEIHYWMQASSPEDYSLTLKLRGFAFNGTVLGTSTVVKSLNWTANTEVIFTFSPPVTVPASSGQTVTFEITKNSGSGFVFGADTTQSSSCPTVETNGNSVPLDTQSGNRAWSMVIFGDS
ncbi:MAG: hypothetical protein ACXWOH_08600 [Bdellovibrionota bacterium]